METFEGPEAVRNFLKMEIRYSQVKEENYHPSLVVKHYCEREKKIKSGHAEREKE